MKGYVIKSCSGYRAVIIITCSKTCNTLHMTAGNLHFNFNSTF